MMFAFRILLFPLTVVFNAVKTAVLTILGFVIVGLVVIAGLHYMGVTS